MFLTAVYVGGQIASRLLYMPSLVGEIFVGILLGPPLADFVPNPTAWVLFGEIGLVLLVLEAGIDIDLTMVRSDEERKTAGAKDGWREAIAK